MGKELTLQDVLTERIQRVTIEGRTQREIADAVGIRPTYLSALLKGDKNKPSPQVAARLAEVLASDPDDKASLLVMLQSYTGSSRRPSSGTFATHESTLDKLERTGVFTAGIIPYSPFIEVAKGADPSGYVIDIMREIKELAHLAYELRVISWDKMQIELATGKIDVVLSGVFATLSRLPQMTFVPLPFFDPDGGVRQEIIGSMDVIVRGQDRSVLPKNSIAAYELEDKLQHLCRRGEDLNLAVFRGEFGEDIASIFIPKATRRRFIGSELGEAARSLRTKEVDVILCDSLTAKEIADSNNSDFCVFDIAFDIRGRPKRTYYEPSVGLAVRRSDSAWRQFLEDAVETVVCSPAPSMRRSLKRYYPKLKPFLRSRNGQ